MTNTFTFTTVKKCNEVQNTDTAVKVKNNKNALK